MERISNYINNILTPMLLKFGASHVFVTYTAQVVFTQMVSLLKHWDDRNFRSTILLLGIEEGSFYEPAAKIDVKSFVVVTLRNSPFEVLQSDDFAEAGLKEYISSKDVKSVTSAAIQYFNKQNFDELCKAAKNIDIQDLYAELTEKYPVTFTALQKVATASAKSLDYSKVKVDTPYELEELSQEKVEETKSKTNISFYDGYNKNIDKPLMELLYSIANNSKNCFITDSFKSLTRNVEKLFCVIEFLLTHNCAFVTANVYLENGHVEKRIKPLRACHSLKEVPHNLSQTAGLGYCHKSVLSSYMKQLLKSNQ